MDEEVVISIREAWIEAREAWLGVLEIIKRDTRETEGKTKEISTHGVNDSVPLVNRGRDLARN